MAIMLYEQFIHLKRMNLHPNSQLLDPQQRAYHTFLVPSWVNSVNVTVACWVNFIEKYLHVHELQLPDYNV